MQHVLSRIKELIQKHDTRNPMKIAELEGIIVKNKFYEETKGYFVNIFDSKYIVLNQALNEFIYLFVFGHELYHALYHSENDQIMQFDKGIFITATHDLFCENTIYEREANLFSYYLSEHIFTAYQDELPEELISYIRKNILRYKRSELVG